MDFDPRVGPVNLNGGSQDPEPAVGVAIFRLQFGQLQFMTS